MSQNCYLNAVQGSKEIRVEKCLWSASSGQNHDELQVLGPQCKALSCPRRRQRPREVQLLAQDLRLVCQAGT